mmetsp:Transcript_9838/g.25320  ORF Transcript_9838/g.25320 Transcript_9838/m.25320 type:complete len:235 (-) Transcript_9838:880-1584(-)
MHFPAVRHQPQLRCTMKLPGAALGAPFPLPLPGAAGLRLTSLPPAVAATAAPCPDPCGGSPLAAPAPRKSPPATASALAPRRSAEAARGQAGCRCPGPLPSAPTRPRPNPRSRPRPRPRPPTNTGRRPGGDTGARCSKKEGRCAALFFRAGSASASSSSSVRAPRPCGSTPVSCCRVHRRLQARDFATRRMLIPSRSTMAASRKRRAASKSPSRYWMSYTYALPTCSAAVMVPE